MNINGMFDVIGTMDVFIPYHMPFSYLLIQAVDITRSQWTCPNNKKYWLFDRVHT